MTTLVEAHVILFGPTRNGPPKLNLGLSYLDCYLVGSLDFDFLENRSENPLEPTATKL